MSEQKENEVVNATEAPAAAAEATTEREPREARRGGRERNPNRERGSRDADKSQFMERVEIPTKAPA